MFSFRSFLATVSLFSLFLVITYLLRLQWTIHLKKKKLRSRTLLSKIMTDTLGAKERLWCIKNRQIILDDYISLSQTVILNNQEDMRFQTFLTQSRADIYYVRLLSRRGAYHRCRASRYLGYIKTQISCNSLVNSLMKEKKERVKIYILHSLSLLEFSASIPTIIDSLKGSSPAFIGQVSGVLQNFRSSFIALFPVLSDHREQEVQEVIIDFAMNIPSILFGPYLLNVFNDPTQPIHLQIKAFQALIESYPQLIDPSDYIRNSSREIYEAAIMGLGHIPTEERIEQLIDLLDDKKYRDLAIKSLSNGVQKSSAYFQIVNNRLKDELSPGILSSLIEVVSNRIDYFLPLIDSQRTINYEMVIREVLKSGRVSNIISFMNENHSSEIENILVSFINSAISEDKIDTSDFQIYLKDSLLIKLGMSKIEPPQKRINEKNEGVRQAPLYMILFLVASSLSWLIIWTFRRVGINANWFFILKSALNNYLLIFGYYCLLLNFLYYFLFFLSFLNSRNQSRYWHLKDDSLLFTRKVLPSLSILVPAYGEEATIIDNILSLLNLRYPDYEVIVINDGSKDRTLQVLIDYFMLDKEDLVYKEHLKTQPVRGIYRNKSIPELTVIDKINGGKADSLNTGLNLASKDYFAGIDSDSLLERDALLKLTSAFLDQDSPVAAAGGNIMPVNGCQVDRGVLEKIALPSHPIALFQIIEYIRSFMTGRMGWAYMKTLLIISGAFGVFRRSEIIKINGYLTSREIYMKDTVGEDMELVVRLSRNLKEKGNPFTLLYLYLANCWTEVPQSFTILRKQRERWQRGLIDILSFHRKMMFNRQYGTIGLIGFPYYLIAEVIGPWFETLANLFFLLGIITGWVSLPVLMLVFGANFVLSFSLSLSSLLIMDWEGSLFSWKDRIILIFMSLAETLGFRQVVSFFRISGFVGVLRNVTGWGTMTRQGFSKKGD